MLTIFELKKLFVFEFFYFLFLFRQLWMPLFSMMAVPTASAENRKKFKHGKARYGSAPAGSAEQFCWHKEEINCTAPRPMRQCSLGEAWLSTGRKCVRKRSARHVLKKWPNWTSQQDDSTILNCYLCWYSSCSWCTKLFDCLYLSFLLSISMFLCLLSCENYAVNF